MSSCHPVSFVDKSDGFCRLPQMLAEKMRSTFQGNNNAQVVVFEVCFHRDSDEDGANHVYFVAWGGEISHQIEYIELPLRQASANNFVPLLSLRDSRDIGSCRQVHGQGGHIVDLSPTVASIRMVNGIEPAAEVHLRPCSEADWSLLADSGLGERVEKTLLKELAIVQVGRFISLRVSQTLCATLAVVKVVSASGGVLEEYQPLPLPQGQGQGQGQGQEQGLSSSSGIKIQDTPRGVFSMLTNTLLVD